MFNLKLAGGSNNRSVGKRLFEFKIRIPPVQKWRSFKMGTLILAQRKFKICQAPNCAVPQCAILSDIIRTSVLFVYILRHFIQSRDHMRQV